MNEESVERIENEACQSKLLGRYAEAKKLRRELERLHEQNGTDLIQQAKNLNQLAFLAAACEDPEEAVRAARKCVAIYQQVPNKREDTLATYLMMLAYVLAEGGCFSEAVSNGEMAVSMFGRLYGEQDDFVKYRLIDIQCMRREEVRPYLDK